MSSRAMRRALAARLEADNDEAESSSEETEETRAPTVNPFLAFGDASESEESQEEEPEPVKAKQPTTAKGGATSAEAPGSSTKKGKKKKKKKAKKSAAGADGDGAKEEAKAEAAADASLKEVDRAIREVQEQFGELDAQGEPPQAGGTAAAGTPGTVGGNSAGILEVNPRELNAELELQRKFHLGRGRAGVASGRGPVRMRGRAVRAMMVLPKDTWPRMSRAGLAMVLDKTDHATGEAWYKFQHSAMYQSVQLSFLRAVRTMDPEAISHVLRAHPYHIDSLLQLSEVCKMSGDMQTAGSLIERALYALEASFHPSFKVATGRCRLDYNIYENRAVHLALFRHIEFISQRGCWNAAMELSKLLLSLDPDGDPLGALLFIDYFALRARKYTYLRNMCNTWRTGKSLDWLPNFAYSEALAYFLDSHESEDSSAVEALREQADARLQLALIRFPSVLTAMVDKCHAHLRPVIAGHRHFQDPSAPSASERNVMLMTVLYVERAHTLYSPEHVLAWLQSNAMAVLENLEIGKIDAECAAAASRRKTHYPRAPKNVQRHVLLLELREALGLLPADVTRQTIMAYDPLPPDNAPSPYDERVHEPEEEPASNFSVFEAVFRSLLPTYNADHERRRLAQQGRQMAPDFDAGALRLHLREAWSQMNLANLFNRQDGEEGEAVEHDAAAYFEGADAEDLELLDEGENAAEGDDA